MDKPFVSVVVPVFDRWDLTHPCLAGLRRSLKSANAEVIVVDNGSTDATAHELERLFPWVRVVRHASNLGFAEGSNTGLAAARGEHVIFLNNDTRPDGKWWRPMLAQLDDPAVGVCGALITSADRRRVNHAGIVFGDAGREPVPTMPLPEHLYREVMVKALPRKALKPRALQAVTGACMAMRRTTALDLGGFCTDYWNGFEDVDLCFRTRFTLGRQVVIAPKAVMPHWESQTKGRFDREEANAVLFNERWGGKIRRDLREVCAADGWG